MYLISNHISLELISMMAMLVGILVVTRQQNRQIQSYEKRLKILKSDMQALLLCSRGVGEKINFQQREFRNLVERQDRLELSEQSDPSYRQASALFDRGASEDEMIDTCDLTQAEVELIAQLRQSQNRNQNIELVA